MLGNIKAELLARFCGFHHDWFSGSRGSPQHPEFHFNPTNLAARELVAFEKQNFLGKRMPSMQHLVNRSFRGPLARALIFHGRKNMQQQAPVSQLLSRKCSMNS
jgi:hypothetical protein